MGRDDSVSKTVSTSGYYHMYQVFVTYCDRWPTKSWATNSLALSNAINSQLGNCHISILGSPAGCQDIHTLRQAIMNYLNMFPVLYFVASILFVA